MELTTTMAILILICVAVYISIKNSMIEAAKIRSTHRCLVRVKSRTTGYEYYATAWRDYRGSFMLLIYNNYSWKEEWHSVFHFENSEKIIKQLTNAKEK